MTVLITGATGRVGSRLAQALLDRGATVRTLALPDDPNLDRLRRLGVDCHVGSITHLDDILPAVAGVDTIVHLAALILWGRDDRPALWNVNVQGTYYLLEAASRLANRPLRIVLASSDQVYPAPNAKYRPTDEGHPRYTLTFYGLTKILDEELVHFYSRSESQFHTTVARFSHTEAADEIIDPHGSVSRRVFYVNGRLNALKASGSTDPKVLATIATLEPLAASDEPLLLPLDMAGNPWYLELVDVRDIVQGLLLILDRPQAVGETFNLTPPTVVNLGEFIPFMAEATGRRYVEARLAIDPVLCHADGTKARALLGYRPRYTLFDMVDHAVGRPRDPRRHP